MAERLTDEPQSSYLWFIHDPKRNILADGKAGTPGSRLLEPVYLYSHVCVFIFIIKSGLLSPEQSLFAMRCYVQRFYR